MPKWRRLGRLLTAGEGPEWMQTHVAHPAAFRLPNGGWKVHFASRDGQGRSQIGAFDLELEPQPRAHNVSSQPLIPFGPLGAFDDCGATCAWIVASEGGLRHFYTGWTRGRSVPFRVCIGVAESADGGRSFARPSLAPALGINAVDPYMVGSPCILRDKGLWRMWYASGLRWDPGSDGPRHFYHIRYAESDDSFAWRRDGRVCIDFQSAQEYAVTRPSVVKDADRYRMWFCARGEAYRLGYAESDDGLRWRRLDGEAGLEPAAAGWDSEMIAYPFVFDQGGKRFLLYNGNGYGASGLGLAVWE